jgi:four helix bundle protein
VARGDDIEERLIDFAVRVLRVSGSLPETAAGRHVGEQLLRCGTSPAAKYGEARGSESNRDFVHKLLIALKELNEARVWLRIIVHGELLPVARMEDLLDENEQLCRVLGSSIQTVLREAKG